VNYSPGEGWWLASDGNWYPPPRPEFPPMSADVVRASSPPMNQSWGDYSPSQYGARPEAGFRLCLNCGIGLKDGVSFCPQCGLRYSTLPRNPKSKLIAILIAFFLPGWSFAYTYQADKKKFWIAVAVDIGSIFVGLWPLATLGIWIWAIINASVRNQMFYRNYPNG
jgi:hypothetical protein